MAVGEHSRHPEWQARANGSAKYTGDIELDGMLHGAMVRSPWPHAKIRAIDASAALRIDGVVAVLTSQDMPSQKYQDYGVSDRQVLAHGRVRHVGEQVAVVLADSEEAARLGAACVKVRYRRLRTVHSPFKARGRSAPKIHDAETKNVAVSIEREHGSIADARARANTTVSGRYRYPNQAHACMEPSVVVASYDSDTECLNLWTPTQAARNIQREIALLMDLQLEQVRLHEIAVGGDFGSRVRASDIEAVAAAATMHVGRPVRIRLSRQEEFANTKHRFDFHIDLTTGLDADGGLVYRDADVLVDCGGYAHAGGNELTQATALLTAQYEVSAARARGAAVYSNTSPGGSFRGAGFPQAVFALESQMDEIADARGIDPAAFRLQYFNTAQSETLNGWKIDTLAIRECLDAVLGELDWDRARAGGGSGRGVGIAAAIHVTGAVVSPASSTASGRVTLTSDGRVTVSTGASDPGTGQALVAAQVTATELGLDTDQVSVSTMDTHTTPNDPGAGASRGTYTTGRAVQAAGGEMAQKLRVLAADKLGVTTEDIQLSGGYARYAGEAIAIGDLVNLSTDIVDGCLIAEATMTAEIPINMNPSAGGNISPSYSCAVHGVEVDVDVETGKVKILRVVAAHDAGRIVNPRQAEGQVVGGVVMGLGAALGEELILEGGRVVNTSYLDYPLMRAADAPPVKVIFVGEPDKHGPYGAKGLAEIALSPTAPAVTNAVAHATGLRFRELPVTPDRIVSAHREVRDREAGVDGPSRPRAIWRRPHLWWVSLMRWLYPRGLHLVLHNLSRFSRKAVDGAQRNEIISVPDAERAVAELSTSGARFLGGGTDLLVLQKQGITERTPLVLVERHGEIASISLDRSGGLDIGSMATLAELEKYCRTSGLASLEMVADLIDTIASPQIRNVATVAGNLLQQKRCWFFRNGFDCYKRAGALAPCYAVTGDHRFYHSVSDAHRCQATTPSDLASAFFALDATVEVRSAAGLRMVRIEELYTGPGETVVRQDEVVTRVLLPVRSLGFSAAVEKIALWTGGFAVSTAICAVELTQAGIVSECRVVLGGISPTPYRAVEVERSLRGLRRDEIDPGVAARHWAERAHPLERNEWKVDATIAITSRVLARALSVPEASITERPSV